MNKNLTMWRSQRTIIETNQESSDANQQKDEYHLKDLIINNNPNLHKIKQKHLNRKDVSLNRYSSQQNFYKVLLHKRSFVNKQHEQDRRQSNQFITFNQSSNKYISHHPLKYIPNKVYTSKLQNQKLKRTQKQDNIVNKNSKELQLKQTSSTSSLDRISSQPKKYPSFFKMKNSQKFIKNQSYFNKDKFKILKKLGQGKFANVFLVQEIQSGFIAAMKVFDKNKIKKANFLFQFIRELKIQAFLDNPSIIKLYGFFHDQNYFYTLMEPGCDGELYTMMLKTGVLSEQTTSYVIKSLLTAVQDLHSKKILHRDIKPQNIVLIHGNVKLCDFGWAVQKKEELRSTYCGTPLYFSPELLNGQHYDQKVDIWAIGILAYQLYLGKDPFNIKDQSQLYKIVTNSLNLPLKGISPQFKLFVSKILQKNPQLRPQSSQLLKQPFITKYEQFETCQQLCQ